MNTLPPDSTKPRQQRGAATVAIAMLIIFILVAAVLGVQSISGTSAVDAVKNDEQVTALFLAESGLERTTAIMTRAAASGALSGPDCEGMASATIYSLSAGRSFTIDSAKAYNSAGTNVPSCSGAACAQCVVQVTGSVTGGTGQTAARRTLQGALLTKVSNGSCGFGGKAPNPVKLSLTNPTTLPTLGFFSIGWRQYLNQNDVPAGYTTPAGQTDSSCSVGSCLSWLAKSSVGGSDSAGSLGAVVPNIAKGTSSDSIEMPITEDRPYSAVGILFEPRPGLSGSPVTVNALGSVSSFWDDLKGSKTVTVANATSGLVDVGKVTSGVAHDNTTGECVGPPNTTTGSGFIGSNPNPTTGSKTCNSWCYGGDTIVMGLSGKSEANGDQTSVTFNSVQMKRAIHLPLAPGECPSYTPPDTYTEIHYLYNHDYISAANTATSGGTFNGVVGIPSSSFNAKINKATLKLTVNASMGAGRKLFIGDAIYCNSNAGGCDNTSKDNQIATVLHYPSGPGGCSESPDLGCAATGPSNTYDVTMTSVGNSNFSDNIDTYLLVKSDHMQTTQTVTDNWLSVGDNFQVTAGTNRTRTITGVPCTLSGFDTCNISGIYRINAFDEFSQNGLISKGYTIHVSGGFISTGINTSASTPGAPIADTVVAVRDTGGSGELPAKSCVVSSPTPASTVFQLGTLEFNGTANVCNASLRPVLKPLPDVTDRLVTATVCGGTCGLFVDPDETTVTTSTGFTPFQVTRNNADTKQWAAGFICIKGIDPAKAPTIVTTSSTKSSRWSEVVR